MLDPPRAGLTNSGQPSSAMASSTRLRSASAGDQVTAFRLLRGPVALAHHHVRPDRQPLGLEDDLHVLLVHADRAGQHAGPDVGDAGHLQQALDGAVLAERAVQHRQHHVDVAEQVRVSGRARVVAAEAARVGLAADGPGTTCAPGSATASTDGSWPPAAASLAGSSAASTQPPSRVIPTGTTSYLSRSIDPSMLPPPMQDTACSGPLPPKTTATRILRCLSTLLLQTP